MENYAFYDNNRSDYLLIISKDEDDAQERLQSYCHQYHRDQDDFVYVGNETEIRQFLIPQLDQT